MADTCDEAEQALSLNAEVNRYIITLTQAIGEYLDRQRQYDWQSRTVERPDGEGIPETSVDGWLPPGQWTTTWEQLVARYGYSNHRRQLMRGLLTALHMLKKAGCRKVMIAGSFVTSKPEPHDIDMCWFEEGIDFDVLDPVLKDDCVARQMKLGIDAHANEDWKLKLLSNQILWYDDEADYSQFLPLPKVRAVGVLILDPCQPLPEPDAFFPESTTPTVAE